MNKAAGNKDFSAAFHSQQDIQCKEMIDLIPSGYILQKDFSFEASHQLPNHDGKCARLHGHSWKGTVYVKGEELHVSGPKQGMVMDYGDIKHYLNDLIENFLDHHHLNATVDLVPTSENIARFVYNFLKSNLPSLVMVRIEETCTARCDYYGERR